MSRGHAAVPRLVIAALVVLGGLMVSASLTISRAAAADPVIAAAGDIACDPGSSSYNNGSGTSSSCRQKYTAALLTANLPNAVLDLGDNQYYCGSLTAYQKSYAQSWGQSSLFAITHPSPGNHEYLTSGGTGCTSTNANAAGYFKYFGAAAGSQTAPWYSWNLGSWHLVSLDSNCGNVGGCGTSSKQGGWLANDLKNNTEPCILAFWHIPLYSSGGRAANNMQSVWNQLYKAGADVVLSGHDHIYERFALQDAYGNATPNGIREFIVGTGGANHTSIASVAKNSQVRNASTFGVLRLTLHSSSYSWTFQPEKSGGFTDSGTQACH